MSGVILTCPQCQTQYDLTSEQLGVGGRKVRCVECHTVWFQSPEGEQTPIPAPAPPPASITPAPEPPPPSPQTTAAVPPPLAEPLPATPATAPAATAIQEALGALIDKTDTEGKAEKDAKDGDIFETILTGISEAEKALGPMPEDKKTSAKKKEAQTAPPITHNPLGVSAKAFGGLVFAMLLFITFGLALLVQKPVLRHWPQMALLYRTIGLHPMAPGEGLQLSDVTAELQIEKQAKRLVVEGKMTNISEKEMTYPPLHVTLKNADSKVIKEWTLKPGATKLSAGETVPVMLQLPDAPQEGATIDVQVKE